MDFREKFKRSTALKLDRVFEHQPVELVDIQAEMTDKGRVYVTPDGKRYPSVTTVLSLNSKDSIARWRKRVGEEEANKISTTASNRGTRIHNLCEDYVNNKYQTGEKTFSANPADIASFQPIQIILDKHVGKIFAVEAPLYSHLLRTAGRTDLIAEWDGEPAVIDFKTAKKIKERAWVQNYFQQGACYCSMWEERTGMTINKFVIIISVDGEAPQVFIEKRDDYLPAFKKTRLAYKQAYLV
jgi:hypothetical protein